MLAVLRQGRAGQEDGGGDETARELRAAAGVLVNELARPLLFLDLPDSFGGIAGSGEPACLSLHALIRSVPTWNVHSRDVFVCENPNLGGGAIAADALGRTARHWYAPMGCQGGPAGAAVAAGHSRCAAAPLRQFRLAGIAIADVVAGLSGAVRWRFGAVDYCAAVDSRGNDTSAQR